MTWTLSEFLNLLEIRGRSWCIIELRETGGFSIPPNDGVIWHSQLEGASRIGGLGGKPIEMAPGDIRIVLSGASHAVRAHPDNHAEPLEFFRSDDHDLDIPPTYTVGEGPIVGRMLCSRLRSDWPQELRRAAIPPVVGLNGNDDPVYSGVRTRLLETWSLGIGATAMLTNIAQIGLTLALRNHPDCPLLFRMSTSRNPIIHAQQLIKNDPSADWTVAGLASKVGMRRSNFAARFATEVGRSPMTVITEHRMRQAQKLIQNSDLKISTISQRIGYGSEAAFIRRFTRFFGMTPGKMRQRLRSGMLMRGELSEGRQPLEQNFVSPLPYCPPGQA